MQFTFFLTYIIPLICIGLFLFFYIWFFNRKLIVHFMIFIFFMLVYVLSNLANVHVHSLYNHYPLLADAILHGRASLDFTPGFHDFSTYQGKVFIAQPPLPAFLMIPFVFIYGKEFNDIIFTILIGAINCVLVYSTTLRLNGSAKGFSITRSFAFFITLLFGLGTVHWEVTVRGTVWHTAHIVTLFFLLLAVREALGKRRYLLMGVFAALAVLARPSVFWAFPFFVALAFFDHFLKKGYRTFVRQMLLFVAPYVAAGFLLGFWNYIRFGNPLDFGFANMNHAAHLQEALGRFGTLNLSYLPINLDIAFLFFFKIVNTAPYVIPLAEGLAIQYTSPFLLYFFAPLWYLIKERITKVKTVLHYNTEIVTGSILAAVCTAIPLLLYFNTGWVQFGYRYILDYVPFLLLLLAYCMRGRITKLAIALAVLAIVVNCYGMILYIHFEGVPMSFG